MSGYHDSPQSGKRFDSTLPEAKIHRRTEDIIEAGSKAETEEGTDRGRNTRMRGSTAKRPAERIDAGTDQAKGAEIEGDPKTNGQ